MAYGNEPIYDTAGHVFSLKPWFVGKVNGGQEKMHERLLRDGIVGDFIVRESEGLVGGYTLVIKAAHNKLLFPKISFDADKGFQMVGAAHHFQTMDELLDKIKKMAVTPARHVLAEAPYWIAMANTEPVYDTAVTHLAALDSRDKDDDSNVSGDELDVALTTTRVRVRVRENDYLQEPSTNFAALALLDDPEYGTRVQPPPAMYDVLARDAQHSSSHHNPLYRPPAAAAAAAAAAASSQTPESSAPPRPPKLFRN